MTSAAALPYGIPAPAGRLPDSLSLGPVRLAVRDLDRSVAFYSTVLGLRVLTREGQRASLGVSAASPLVLLAADPALRPIAPRGRLGLFHFAILLPDRGDLGRFIAHLTAIGARAGASDHLVSEALYLTDPDGLGIEVYADRPRASWTQERRQLRMSTEPLDLGALVRAGGDAPWRGMPASTVMGHLHLHVGDLAAAARFYHEVLGLDQMVWDYPGALFLSAGGYHHHLGLNTWAAGAAPAGPQDARLLAWEMGVPSVADLEMVSARLGAAGLAWETLRDGATGLLLRDPWGTPLRIVVVD